MQENDDAMIHRDPDPPSKAGWWVGIAALTVITALAVAGLVRARNQAREMDANRAQVSAALNQAQSQIQALTAKLEALNAAEQAREAEAQQTGRAERAASHRGAAARFASHSRVAERKPKDDPRLNQIESQLAAQQRQLAKTQDDLAKAQTDMEGRLNSTRDDLNSSIAKTHDQLVAMEKRGERNYYEFQLDKSKELQRVGPISLALRKTNTKHDYYDMTMQVDDFKLEKKHVNLYEPVWINLSDRPQPLQLVVNQIGKNHVAGYLSEPKYKKSELAADTGTPANSAPPPQLQPR
ncbi:MAG TPA: hypothetical protein VFA33_19945 [Bryobacteraceae bacterium]|nr:hypothetical protein [Bryobacteraceae bacterium]